MSDEKDFRLLCDENEERNISEIRYLIRQETPAY